MSFLAVSITGVLCAQTKDTPLFALPYSPSLDVSSMDRSVDPCDDFYHYACGGWIKKNPIPPDQARWDVYGKLAEENQRFLWGILEQAAKPEPGRSKVETEIGDYFHACMDEAAVEKAGAAPLKPELDEIAALQSIRDLPALPGAPASRHRAATACCSASAPTRISPIPRRVIAFAERRRPGPAGSRLLHQDRREIAGDAPEVRGARAENVRAAGRAAADGQGATPQP